MADLPRLALSVRQPWAWAIVAAGKDIENRSWQAVNHGLRQRGRICVHAAKGMTREEYEDAAEFMATLGVTCPPAADLIRSAIIGSVEVIDVVSQSDSPWFFGPRGLVLRGAELWSPIPCIGRLGYFDWKRAEIDMPAPAKWMLPKAAEPQQELPVAAKDAGPDLFAFSSNKRFRSRAVDNKLWIVYGSTGEYSDRNEWAVAIVDCEDDAKLLVTKLQQQYLTIPPQMHEDRWDHTDEMKAIMSLDPGFESDYTGTTYSYGWARHLNRLDLEKAIGA